MFRRISNVFILSLTAGKEDEFVHDEQLGALSKRTLAGNTTDAELAHALSSLHSIVAHKFLAFVSLSPRLLFLLCFDSYCITWAINVSLFSTGTNPVFVRPQPSEIRLMFSPQHI
jgi:hypothetical protein